MNEIWTADLMNGPPVAGRACHLAAIIDDNSRFLTGYQFIRRPDAVRFAGVLHAAIARHGGLNVLMGNLVACRDVVIWGIDLKKGMELGP